MKALTEATVVSNQQEANSAYYLLQLHVPTVANQVQPGQFVHLQVPNRPDLSLRRPFSIFKAGNGGITLFYKIVGTGTASLATITPNAKISIMGPLGTGFPKISEQMQPVLVAGGYGSAALYLVAKRSPIPGTIFIGGRTKDDIFGATAFSELGWEVIVTTEDGSLGTKGLVTAALDLWLEKNDHATDRSPEFFACGPNPMLKEIGKRAIAKDYRAWLSIDRPMGCGIGVCLACAQKIRAPDGSNVYQRTCTEGPVFECREIVWD